MVYRCLIQVGDVRILRASKLINQEAIPHLSQVASLRVNLGRTSNSGSKVNLPLTAEITLSGALTLIAPDYIQHIDLRLDMTTRALCPIETTLMTCFTGNKVIRKSCTIIIKFGSLGPLPRNSFENKPYEVIAALTGFDILTVKPEYGRDAAHQETLRRRMGHIPGFNARRHATFMLFEYSEKISAMLQGTLGPATLDRSVGEPCLKFSPLAYQKSKLSAS